MNVALLVVCYNIIGNVLVEISYILSQMAAFLPLVENLDSVDHLLKMRMFWSNIVMAWGSILCSIYRTNIEAEISKPGTEIMPSPIINQTKMGQGISVDGTFRKDPNSHSPFPISQVKEISPQVVY